MTNYAKHTQTHFLRKCVFLYLLFLSLAQITTFFLGKILPLPPAIWWIAPCFFLFYTFQSFKIISFKKKHQERNTYLFFIFMTTKMLLSILALFAYSMMYKEEIAAWSCYFMGNYIVSLVLNSYLLFQFAQD